MSISQETVMHTEDKDFNVEENEKAMDELAMNMRIAARKARAKALIVTPKIVAAYLGYECNFGCHKGDTWGQVIDTDYEYMRWLLINVMDTDTSLFKVLARCVLNEKEIELAKSLPRTPTPAISQEAPSV